MRHFARAALGLVGAGTALLLLLAASALWVSPPPDGPVPGVADERIHQLETRPDGTWTVAILSDIQGGPAYLPEVLSHVATADPQAIVLLGDIAADGDPGNMNLPARGLAGAPAPLFAIPGNHDQGPDDGLDAYRARFVATSFDVRIGATRLIGLDNADMYVEPAQLAALDGQLRESAARGEQVVLCLHRPVANLSPRQHDAEDRNADLLALIREHGAAMVIVGHLHSMHDETRDGTRYVVVPSTGDTGSTQGLTRVSYTLLHGPSLQIELGGFPRRNLADLRGRFEWFALAMIRPWRDEAPGAFAGGLAVLAAACVGAWWARRRLGRAAK